jgi:hypothetical protein
VATVAEQHDRAGSHVIESPGESAVRGPGTR